MELPTQEVRVRRADEAQELARLLAAEREELGDSVELLRQRGPDAAQLASLSSRLALRGIDVSTPSPSPLPTPWKRWALGGGGAASAVFIWFALRGPQALPEPARGAPALERRSPPPVASLASSPRAARDDTNGNLRAGGATTDARSPSESAAVPSTPAPSRPLEGTVTPPMAHDRQHSDEPSGVEPIDARERGAERAAAPSPGRPELPPSSSGVPTEIELLRDARFALAQSPSRALELTEQHARFHPNGKLVQEREVIALTALVALGRRTAALARGASFERSFPGSAYRKQVSELLR